MPAVDLVLTVAQSKRLIAKAVPLVDVVRRAWAEGMVIVGKGSTAACVAEELLGHPIDKTGYIHGRTMPEGFRPPEGMFRAPIPEMVFRQGKPVEGLTLAEAAKELEAGDVVIKGANALDYRAGLVGHLVGHPEGGTLGTIMGQIHGKGAYLVVPVGLEKTVGGDLLAAARKVESSHADTSLPRLWVTTGHIVTEIEALRLLGGVEAVHIASGGICGAEGAVWLRVLGSSQQLEAVLALAAKVQAEPSYLEAWEERRGAG
jgi:hypothetical protein